MSFLRELGLTAKARTQRAAVLNRLRAVLRCEERAIEKEYLALGRYYYNALRDKDNPVAEGHCASIDQHQAALDGILNTLEQMESFTISDDKSAASVGVIAGSDGPTAVFVAGKAPSTKKKEGTLFHFNKGPIEVTVSREPAQDSQPDLADENAEVVDLEDVAVFDHDPILEEPAPPEKPASPEEAVSPEEPVLPAEPNTPPANPDENDGLPFEG